MPGTPQIYLVGAWHPQNNAPYIKLNACSGKWISILISSLASSHAFSYAVGKARSGLRRRGSTWLDTKGILLNVQVPHRLQYSSTRTALRIGNYYYNYRLL